MFNAMSENHIRAMA